jgi:hypothetical protein
MSDLTERLRNMAEESWEGRGPVEEALHDAADRIDELEAALVRASIQYIDFDDGSGGFYIRCGACRAIGRSRAPQTELRHSDDCLYAEITRRALGDEA